MENDKNVKDLIIDGLLIDGSHHKQWYLEKIYIKLFGKKAPMYLAADGETPLEKEPEGDEDYYSREEGIAP